jgi:hypothetical protein
VKPLESYTPAGLYAASYRHSDGWTVDETVEEYMKLHPDAGEAAVRKEIEARLD